MNSLICHCRQIQSNSEIWARKSPTQVPVGHFHTFPFITAFSRYSASSTSIVTCATHIDLIDWSVIKNSIKTVKFWLRKWQKSFYEKCSKMSPSIPMIFCLSTLSFVIQLLVHKLCLVPSATNSFISHCKKFSQKVKFG